MRIQSNQTITTTLLVTLLFSALNPALIFGQKKGTEANDHPLLMPVPLAPRALFSKPIKTVIDDPADAKLLVLKFAEGTRVRVRDGQLLALLDQLTSAEEDLLKRQQIAKEQVQAEVQAVQKLLAQTGVAFEPLFTRDETKLDFEKLTGELESGEELADLNLYFYLVPPGDIATSEYVLNELNKFASVELAYAQPPAAEAQTDIAPGTPDFRPRQGYLDQANTRNPATNGIDAAYAWNRGATGRGVRVVDVEQGWWWGHEDFGSVFHTNPSGYFAEDAPARNHGTAVLGVMGAPHNGYGVSGIAPDAQYGVAPVFRRYAFAQTGHDVAGAINYATASLQRGDLILVEQQRKGPRSFLPCPANCSQFEMIAMEYWQAEFDAIRHATARGIIVVEAAGNGSMNLDAARYNRRFDRTRRDSGALIVGAGLSTSRVPQPWTCFGSRVDVHGWGDGVMTLGYGVLSVNGADTRQWYTSGFSGTSSASPIVTGAAALIQSGLRNNGWPVLNSFEMRDLLSRTGTAQGLGARIGPLPDVARAFGEIGLGSDYVAASRLLLVHEHNFEVDAGIEIQNGDRVVFLAAGEIFAGTYRNQGGAMLALTNGPDGWRDAMATSAMFPLRGAVPYGLIGQFGGSGYFQIGRTGEQRYFGPPTRLYLRINDEQVANGSGAFLAWVRVYR